MYPILSTLKKAALRLPYLNPRISVSLIGSNSTQLDISIIFTFFRANTTCFQPAIEPVIADAPFRLIYQDALLVLDRLLS